MKYDFAFFDNPIDRHGTDCIKWDMMAAREGHELLPMWVADMDFRSPEEVAAALTQRAAHPVYGYTQQAEASVEALLSFLQRRHGVMLTQDQQLMLPCVVTGLRMAINAFTQPGDHVLVQPPVYAPFIDAVRQNERELVVNPLVADAQGRYSMDMDAMEAAFRQGVRLAILCSPHNPVARVWSREEMEVVYALCRRYGVLMVVDEIHADFVYAPPTFTSAMLLDDSHDANLMVFTSAGKTFNLAGLQQGVLLTRNPKLLQGMKTLMQRTGIVAGNIFAMIATAEAYRHGDEWLDGLLAYLRAARVLLREELARQLPGVIMTPQEATYLAWLDMRAYGLTDSQLTQRTHDQGVAFSAGTIFDPQLGEGFLRFNFACPHAQTREAVTRLARAVSASPS